MPPNQINRIGMQSDIFIYSKEMGLQLDVAMKPTEYTEDTKELNT